MGKGRPRKWGMFTVENDAEMVYQDSSAEIEALKDEMEEWWDNLQGTAFETTEKAERVWDAKDALEDALSQIESAEDQISDIFPKLDIIQYQEERRQAMARWKRLANAVNAMKALAEEIDDYMRKHKDEMEDAEEVESGLIELEAAVDDLASVEFPGMFS